MKANKFEERKGMTEINLTSLVDVSLTLVIIFMVSSPFVMQSGIRVSTPQLARATQEAAASELKAEVYIRSGDILMLNGATISRTAFPDSLSRLLASSTNKTLLISAEDDVLHDDVIAIMDAAKQCGAQKLALVKRR